VGQLPLCRPVFRGTAGSCLPRRQFSGITLPPTLELSSNNWRNWHFLFNSIPDLPEALLEGRERVLIEWFFQRKAANPAATFSRADIDEYERVYRAPGGLRGMLAYYRAVAEDMEQNREIGQHRLKPPTLALGGEVGSARNILETLRHHCSILVQSRPERVRAFQSQSVLPCLNLRYK